MSRTWKRWMALLVFIISFASDVLQYTFVSDNLFQRGNDASGTPKLWENATNGDDKLGEDLLVKDLKSRVVSERIIPSDGSRISLSSSGLASVTRSPSNLVFCVANASANLNSLRNGLDWACGPGLANCSAIQPGQPCYIQGNLVPLASYAYNDYYQKERVNGGTCDFSSTAIITSADPSHGSCIFTGSPRANINASTVGGVSPTSESTFGPNDGGVIPMKFFGATYTCLSLLHLWLYM